ncbi:Rieske (2Fe-2S) protein [Paenibacillus allorhizosphaerae]|uniref:3-phenylpropionate/cinnamic acid dioxygenase ferredoxin subunit n=1 Tax=Paenibacillus allorhizosphaerae TaxID=2849866 RepID=A0ABM8VDG6_9BACL|nr:Rieske (2Fe-2S) protein [Paenibacillus allorhizosphaerae]CAG7627499.1 3-phenylpropionate/cinnamic acid dioxygenase ferredoxin subunit [Paenibacillus allorhizosphaerae]
MSKPSPSQGLTSSKSTAPLQRHIVATVSEIPPGAKKIVEAGGRSIGVYNINGQFHALRNVCPHQGAELCKGLVKPLVVSHSPGSFEYEREGEIVRCPWHQWEFDIKTGCMIVDPAMRTKSYEVTVEKFDVSVEEGHVIVHM